MSAKTGIAWTESTWNPTRGCSHVSAGCEHCYAERMAHRFAGAGKPFEGLTRATGSGPRWTGKVRLLPEALEIPLRWRKPRRIFVDSMSDLFHPEVPDEFLLQVFDVIRRCFTERPGHVFQVLTKRAERMQDFCARLRFDGLADDGEGRMWLSKIPAASGFAPAGDGYALVRALPNLWLGVSVENQQAADSRVPLLLETPAAVRFISMEPLLGPIDLRTVPLPDGDNLGNGLFGYGADAGLDWVIVGGESGPGARPCDLEWIRSIVRQCRAAGVPAFVKQVQLGGRLSKDPAEWPEDLRVREFPRRTT